MKYKLLIVVLLICSSKVALSEENKYKFCEIFGLAGGANDDFTQTLASRMLEKQGIEFDKICLAVKQESYRFGKDFVAGKNINNENAKRWMNYQSFRDEITDNILKASGY